MSATAIAPPASTLDLGLEQRIAHIAKRAHRHAKADWPKLERDAIARALDRPHYATVVDAVEDTLVLPARDNAEGGKYRTDRTPYVREPLNSFRDPGVEEIVCCWPTQVGKTTTELAMTAYIVRHDPGPTLFVWPTEDLAKEGNEERVMPMIKESPSLREELSGRSHDEKATRIRLKRMDAHFAWSTSAARLASKPKRFAFFDEVDKYPPFAGKEADPISLAIERSKTFWNRKIVIVSTPTTQVGNIWTRWESSDKRRYAVPCPHCDSWQVLKFSQLKWPKGEAAENIRMRRLAHYECEHCKGEITDRHKPGMLRGGVWVAENPDITLRRGYHLNTLYSPWVSFSEMAAKWIDAQGDTAALMNFINSWLAEPWIEEAHRLDEKRVKMLGRRYSLDTLDESVVMVCGGIDVQETGCYYVVRAYAANQDSWLMEYGFVDRDNPGSSNDIYDAAKLCLDRAWSHPRLGDVRPRMANIDSRHRRDEVLAACRKRQESLRPIMGSPNTMSIPFQAHYVDPPKRKGKRRKRSDLVYYMLDTVHFKDWFMRLYESEPEKWFLPEGVDPDYVKQLLSQHRILEHRGRVYVARWEFKPGNRQDHYLDCEVYALAAADMCGLSTMSVAPVDEHAELITASSWFGGKSRGRR